MNIARQSRRSADARDNEWLIDVATQPIRLYVSRECYVSVQYNRRCKYTQHGTALCLAQHPEFHADNQNSVSLVFN